MNVTALLHQAVKKFRGQGPDDQNGAAGLAEYMGIAQTSLSHKVSPTYPSAHCSPDEVVEICKLTGDHAPLQAMAMNLGYALLPITPADEMTHEHACRVASNAKEFGEYLAMAAAHSVAGKRTTDADMADLAKELTQSIAAQTALYGQLQAAHEARKEAASTLRSLVGLPVKDMA